MKIDLHCHTKATKKGDGDGRNVTPELFAEKVANAGVKILAITNHNHFDKTQYSSLKQIVKDYCQVWPGVEIDIQGKTKFHLIVVANPDNVNLFSSQVDILFKDKDLNKCTLSIEEVYNALNKCDVIYIPHYHKSPDIKEDDKNKLEKIVGDESRIFLELSNHRSLGVYTNHGYRSLVGSDVKDWATYDQCTFAELKLPVDSFHQFCLLAKRDKTIVETLLNKKDSLELTAKPHKSVSIKIRIYQDINIIFGHKGTGKSEILKSLCEDMISHGMSCEQYIANEKTNNFKALTSTSSMDRDLKKVGADTCEDKFLTIMNWNDSIPTAFNLYINWYQTKNAMLIEKQMMSLLCTLKREQTGTLSIPQGIRSIANAALKDSQYSSIILPDSLTMIDSHAFMDCYNLKEIVIPEGVTEICTGAFVFCEQLESVQLPLSLNKVGYGIFGSCNSLKTIMISPDHPAYEMIDLLLVDKRKKEIVNALTSVPARYEIPEGIKGIAGTAFTGCENLTELIVPEGVTSIGHNVFMLCPNLRKIALPASVEEIGWNAFPTSGQVVIVAPEGSYAQEYCKENGYEFEGMKN